MDNLFSKVSSQKIVFNKKELNELKSYYESWSWELESYAKKHFNSGASSNALKKAQLNSLSKALQKQSEQVAEQIKGNITGYLNYTSDNVILAAKEWATQFGLNPGNGAYTSINKQVVNTIISGRLYSKKGKGVEYLSKRIWGDVQGTTEMLEKIVAGGIAQDKSIYEITKTLSQYVNPSAAKMWNLTDKDGRKIYPKKVEYSAQRLARTMSQHAYQRTVALTCKKNPFVSKIRWVANGSRVCPLCEERNGQEYAIGNLPLDHPNGMCVMEPVIDYTDDEIQQQIIDWYYDDPNTNPDVADWIKELDASVDVDKIADKVKDKISSGEAPTSSAKGTTQEQIKKAQEALQNSGKATFSKEEWKNQLMSQQESEFRTTWFGDVDKLSDKEKAFLTKYTGGSYWEINEYLRFGKHEDETFYVAGSDYTNEQTTNILNKTIAKLSTRREVIARRGSDYNMLESLNIDFSETNKDKLIGMVVEDKGFTSTSPVPSGGFNKKYEYCIKVPKGSQAAYVAPISHYENEKELLINSGAKYRIDDVEYKSSGEVKRISMTLINLQN